ncbi:MAG: insulinase family protein [Candidatus Gastranaerophilales bacterium]|nr:insulinase family protein [Candidatus Gastranaerophilales bacterium]
MTKEISKLQNNIEYVYKQNKNTPRMALCLNFSVNEPEEKPGIFSLVARLLLQGTKKYNCEELANEFEKYAIDFSSDLFPNYLRLNFLCLNEDFSKAIELMYEVITNSTFDEFEKEKLKLKGEITAELDSPRAKAMDSYCKAMYENHYYGNSMTKVLESLDTITKEDVLNAYNLILNDSKKALAIVGTLDKNEILPQVEATLGKLPASTDNNFHILKPELKEKKEIINIKSDLNQAHIIKGWPVQTYGEEDYPAFILLNIILGASGLSSRLFLELRDKKGLAYVVRSSYETYKLIGNFMIYIATEPKNIEVSLKGFNEEIEKIKTIPVGEKELQDAKNNLLGKYAFLDETNIQQACSFAKYGVLGFGFDYVEKIKEMVKDVTSEQILNCAQKYFNDTFVLSIIKP